MDPLYLLNCSVIGTIYNVPTGYIHNPTIGRHHNKAIKHNNKYIFILHRKFLQYLPQYFRNASIMKIKMQATLKDVLKYCWELAQGKTWTKVDAAIADQVVSLILIFGFLCRSSILIPRWPRNIVQQCANLLAARNGWCCTGCPF